MSSISIAQPRLGAFPLLRQLIASLGAVRCRLIHRDISRPVHGHYHCWICLRDFRTNW